LYREPFLDDFGNQAGGWPVGESENGSTNYTAGEYRILVKATGNTVWAGRNLKSSYYRAEVDARSDSYADGAYGLYFGQAGGEFCVFQVYNGHYWLRRFSTISGVWTTLFGPTTAPTIGTGERSNRIKVERQGSGTVLSVNEAPLVILASSPDTSHEVGLVASGFAPTFDARFDNFLFVFEQSLTPTPIGGLLPTIVSVEPPDGARTSTVITINGIGFGEDGSVANGNVVIGGAVAGRPLFWSDSRIRVPIPDNATSGQTTIQVFANGKASVPFPYVVQ
jgi:hypothetical protein